MTGTPLELCTLPSPGNRTGNANSEVIVKEIKIGQPAAKLSCTSVDRKNVQRSRFSQPVEPRGAVKTAIFNDVEMGNYPNKIVR